MTPEDSPIINAVFDLSPVLNPWPGSYKPAPNVITQGNSREAPMISAIKSSFMPFCAETMIPVGAIWGRIKCVAHSVSYDFTAKKTKSNCVSKELTSPKCTALTDTLMESPSSWVIVRPWDFI